MKSKMDDTELLQLLYSDFPYIKQYVERTLTDIYDPTKETERTLSYITVNYIIHGLVTNEFDYNVTVTSYYKFFNIKEGNSYKVRRAIYHWIKYNETLVQLRLL